MSPLNGIEDVSIQDLKLIVKTIQSVRPDIEIIDVIYNVYVFDDDTQEDYCEECVSILSYMKENGDWVESSFLED